MAATNGCGSVEEPDADPDADVDADDRASVSSYSSSRHLQPVVKLRKLAPKETIVPETSAPPKKYDFNSVAVVRVRRLWNDLPSTENGVNLLTNGVVKNTKRMRFQTKVLTLDDED